MKRYSLCVDVDGQNYMGEYKHGEYVKLSDVEREMIPRPSTEGVRKAVDDLKSAIYSHTLSIGFPFEQVEFNKVQEAEAAVLKLMGVEVKP